MQVFRRSAEGLAEGSKFLLIVGGQCYGHIVTCDMYRNRMRGFDLFTN